MAKTFKMTIPVEIEVDVADWSTTYGVSEGAVEADARGYLPRTVAHAVHEALEAVANGASLVGPLTDELED